MEPHQRIRYVTYTLLRRLVISIGHDFLQKGGFKPNSYSFFLYGLNALGFISCVYTVICYDVLTALNSLGYGAINIQLLAKILLMRYAQLMTSEIDRIIDVYEQNANTKSRERASILQKMSRLSEMILIGGTIAYLLVAICHFINPIYGYFWQHEFKALFPLYIPFVDEKTAIGFIILLSIQSFEFFTAVIASACADFPFVIIAMNIWVFSTIFNDNVSELNETLRDEKVDIPLVKTKLRNIFEMYNANWILIDDVNTVTFMNNFVVVLFGAVAAAMELFICLTIAFIPTIFMTGLFLFQVCGSCAIGTVIELYNDEISKGLFDCDWYLLPIAEQMKFKFLVMRASLGKTLTLGGIRPLNMDTCVSILRKIYSYVMILHKIIE